MAVSVRLHIYNTAGNCRGGHALKNHTIQFILTLLFSVLSTFADKLQVSCRRGGRWDRCPFMAGLQRSATTFRRSGSSGLVWDERFLTEAEAGADAEANVAGDGAAGEESQPELRHSRSVGSIGMLRRVGGAGGGDGDKEKKEQQKKGRHKDEDARSKRQVFRTKDVAPDVDPPSPRVSGCILCAIFGSGGSGAGAGKARRRSNKPRKK